MVVLHDSALMKPLHTAQRLQHATWQRVLKWLRNNLRCEWHWQHRTAAMKSQSRSNPRSGSGRKIQNMEAKEDRELQIKRKRNSKQQWKVHPVAGSVGTAKTDSEGWRCRETAEQQWRVRRWIDAFFSTNIFHKRARGCPSDRVPLSLATDTKSSRCLCHTRTG